MTAPNTTPLVVIDSHAKPGCWMLKKYRGRELIDKAEIP